MTRVMQGETVPGAPPAAGQDAPAVELPPYLSAIAADAAAVEAGGKQGDAPPVPNAAPAGPSAADEAREVVEVAASLLLPVVAFRWPEVAACYGKAELQRIGDALGAVAEKRGWSVGSVLAGWGPELALAAALAGPALPIVMQRVQAAKAAKEAEAAKPAPAAALPDATAAT